MLETELILGITRRFLDMGHFEHGIHNIVLKNSKGNCLAPDDKLTLLKYIDECQALMASTGKADLSMRDMKIHLHKLMGKECNDSVYTGGQISKKEMRNIYTFVLSLTTKVTEK